MVGRPGRYQPRFIAGQIDRLLQANTDEQIYAKAAAEMVNARVLPQGGFAVRSGLMKIDRVRGQMAGVALSGGPAIPATVVAAGNAVIGTWNCASAITCVDLVFAASLPGGAAPGYASPDPPLSPAIAGTVSVQYFFNGAWANLDNVVTLADAWRSRRFALPAGQTVAASQVRVVVNVTTSGGATVYLTAIGASCETSILSPARSRPFSINAATAYDLLFTPNNVEVYSASGRVASIPLSLTGDQVASFKNLQAFDTMLVTHQAFWPQEITRQGSDHEWNVQPAQFKKVPNYDFGDTVYTNGVAEVLTVTFTNCDTQLSTSSPALPSAGLIFVVTVNGVELASFQAGAGSSANWNNIATQLQNTILTASGVKAGVTVAIQSSYVNTTVMAVTFGGLNAGVTFSLSGVITNKSDAAINVATQTAPVAGGEPIMSTSRGYPGACCLFQQRILLGGFSGVQNAIVASQAGNYFNLDTSSTLSTAAMLLVLDTLGNETILDLHVGRTLDVFTSRGEYWMQPGSLTTTSTPLIVYATNHGIAPGVAPVENEGATIFCAANAGALLEYRYDYGQQNYASTNISVTSSDLVQGVIDMTYRIQVSNVDTGDLYLVTVSGDVVLLSLLRSEQIQAFASMQTDGDFLAVEVNGRFEVNFITQRAVGGATVQFFEKMTDGIYLDCAENVAVGAGQNSIGGLADFEGATVWAVVDGYHQGPFTVSGGTIVLAFPTLAAGTAIVGRWTPPLVRTLPVPRDIAPGVVSRRPCRVHTVRAAVVDSTSLAIGANGSGAFDVAMQFFGGAADTPPMAAPYSGWTLCEGLPGFSEDGAVVLTQLRPGPLKLTGLVVEVDK